MIPLQVLTEAALIAAALGFIVFVVLYQLLTHGAWRRTDIGQNVMALMAVGALLLTVAIVRQFAHFLDAYLDLIRLGSFTLIAGVVWWRVALLIAEQRAKQRAPTGGRPGSEQERRVT